MKIVHISTIDSGGAANAAYQLHAGLVKAGVDSKFLVLHNTHILKDALTFETPPGKFIAFFFRKVRQKIFRLRSSQILRELSSQVEIFSSPDSIYDLLTHPSVKEADLIHLHWVANFIDYKSFFKKNRKPLIWTFHDENPLFGGIHYADDALKLSPALLRLEQTFAETKRKALLKAQRIWPVCPSPWLLNKIKLSTNSDIFEKAICIHYGIDTSQFKLLDKNEARQKLNFSTSKRLLLLICSNLNVYRKGFDLFCELNKKITSDHNVQFILAGQISNLPSLNFSTYIGSITDRTQLVQLYNAADATLIPSREDNLPNVMLESLACGTPVLGFRVGGIQDVIVDGVDGLLSDEVSGDALYEVVLKFLTSGALDREAIRNRAVIRFDNRIQLDRVTKLYQERIQH